MLLKSEWAERFIRACAKVRSARRRSLAAGQVDLLDDARGAVLGGDGRVRQAARPARDGDRSSG